MKHSIRGSVPFLTVGALSLAAVALWNFWPSPSPPPASAVHAAPAVELLPGQIQLQGHFVAGRSKLYAVEETVSSLHGKRYSESGNAIFEDYVGGMEVAPPSVVRTAFVESETCEDVLPDGSARIAYSVRSFEHEELVDGESVSHLVVREPSDLAALPTDRRTALVGSLMEAPIRFRLTPDFAVSELELAGGAAGVTSLEEEYERTLEARFQGFFPGHPVAPGDRWESEMPLEESIAGGLFAAQGNRTTLRAEYVGTELFEGHECARIHIELDFGIEPGTSISRDLITNLIVDELSATTEVLYDIERGLVMSDVTSMRYAAHQIIGLEESEKIMVPFSIEKQVRSAFVGFD